MDSPTEANINHELKASKFPPSFCCNESSSVVQLFIGIATTGDVSIGTVQFFNEMSHLRLDMLNFCILLKINSFELNEYRLNEQMSDRVID